MASDIGSTGKIAIYGIHFEFDKADVKPESEPALKEIAKLLTKTHSLGYSRSAIPTMSVR